MHTPAAFVRGCLGRGVAAGLQHWQEGGGDGKAKLSSRLGAGTAGHGYHCLWLAKIELPHCGPASGV